MLAERYSLKCDLFTQTGYSKYNMCTIPEGSDKRRFQFTYHLCIILSLRSTLFFINLVFHLRFRNPPAKLCCLCFHLVSILGFCMTKWPTKKTQSCCHHKYWTKHLFISCCGSAGEDKKPSSMFVRYTCNMDFRKADSGLRTSNPQKDAKAETYFPLLVSTWLEKSPPVERLLRTKA